jgi:hypothetical protein
MEGLDEEVSSTWGALIEALEGAEVGSEDYSVLIDYIGEATKTI